MQQLFRSSGTKKVLVIEWYWAKQQQQIVIAKFSLVKVRKFQKEWYFVTKIVLTYYEKNCSSDQEKPLKFEAEGLEFAN